ncbi:T9SS type B sorting domain-containing protein [Pontibacter arcticus]|uniref:Gliding motility-associated C-terminal domain-containing protein n=1 Tax=Pontibacter arcticus TaxID=2080288 RepID=A0A364RFQ0_9BACT|nr:gliding motility-associated C-terminal domain-containing protein [Pontibacter arcticus]RAU82986.1 hypothetical protein DP923_07035 [Pontibacter arcticus]
MRFYFILFILLLSGLAVNAQQCFKAYNAQNQESLVFCVGEKVTFKDCSSPAAEADKEYYDYDKSNGLDHTSAEAKAKSFTYTKPGTYTVTQLANLGGTIGNVYKELTIEVKDAPAPTYTAQSCANRVVNFKITDTKYTSYTLDFGDGSTPRTGLKSGQTIAYTYKEGLDYTTKLTGSYTGATCSGTAELKVSARRGFDAPVFRRLRVLNQNASSGQLQFTIETKIPGLSYVIEQSIAEGSPYTQIATIENVTAATETYVLNNINTARKSRYRIRTKDACGTLGSDVSTTLTNVLLDSEFTDRGVLLTWDIDTKSIRRILVDINGVTNPNIDKTDTQFLDADITCTDTYSYVISVDYMSNSTSVSAPVSETIPNVPAPKPGTLFSTFNDDNQVELTFDPKGQNISQVLFERSINGSAFESITASTGLLNYDDLDPIAPVCYRASGSNFCGNVSGVSAVSCPVVLIAEPSGGTDIDFTWNLFKDVKADGKEKYEFQLLDPSKQVISSRPISGTSLSEKPQRPEEQVMYRIKVTLSDGSVSYSNIASVEQNLLLFVPTAFTPNNDGLNDILEVKGQQYFNLQLTIYNRSGNVVFQSDGEATGWDGTFKGKNAPVGVYTYDATYTTAAGVAKRQTGTITLLR